LAGLSTANLDAVLTCRTGIKVVIKTDDTVHFGTRKVKTFGNLFYRVIGNVTNVMLNRMQQRH
jgi:hypothetical protein